MTSNTTSTTSTTLMQPIDVYGADVLQRPPQLQHPAGPVVYGPVGNRRPREARIGHGRDYV